MKTDKPCKECIWKQKCGKEKYTCPFSSCVCQKVANNKHLDTAQNHTFIVKKEK